MWAHYMLNKCTAENKVKFKNPFQRIAFTQGRGKGRRGGIVRKRPAADPMVARLAPTLSILFISRTTICFG